MQSFNSQVTVDPAFCTECALWLFAGAGVLVVLALGIGLQVLLAGRKAKLPVHKAKTGLVALLWALPVLAVLALLGYQAVPHLTPPQK
ncbi:MAG: hypothetical protein ACREIV_11355, partial [Planctomycetaceae bacterium]